MPRIARTVSFAVGLFGALAASQGPEYAQQYRQRLGGSIDELRRMIVRFDEDARAMGLAREDAVARLRANPDRLVSLRGEAMRADLERLDRLEGHRQALAEAGSFGRLWLFARDGDTDVARAAYRDFEPAMPATAEGFVSAGAGFALGYGLARLLGWPLRRLLLRRRRPAPA